MKRLRQLVVLALALDLALEPVGAQTPTPEQSGDVEGQPEPECLKHLQAALCTAQLRHAGEGFLFRQFRPASFAPRPRNAPSASITTFTREGNSRLEG
jgi:hypothetical protein